MKTLKTRFVISVEVRINFIKFCPLWALEQKKTNFEKGKDIKKDKFVPQTEE